MKNIKYILFLLLFISCKNKSTPLTINGHVWNKSENINFEDAKINLTEFDNALEANSKIIASTYTDNNGNFSFNFNVKKSKYYSIYIDGNITKIYTSSLFTELDGQVDFKGSNPPNHIELIVASPSFLIFKLIKDLGSDSLFFEYNHQYLNFYYSRMFTNEELEGPDTENASGNWIYKTTRYLGGLPTVSIDTHYLAPNQHHVIEVHY